MRWRTLEPPKMLVSCRPDWNTTIVLFARVRSLSRTSPSGSVLPNRLSSPWRGGRPVEGENATTACDGSVPVAQLKTAHCLPPPRALHMSRNVPAETESPRSTRRRRPRQVRIAKPSKHADEARQPQGTQCIWSPRSAAAPSLAGSSPGSRRASEDSHRPWEPGGQRCAP